MNQLITKTTQRLSCAIRYNRMLLSFCILLLTARTSFCQVPGSVDRTFLSRFLAGPLYYGENGSGFQGGAPTCGIQLANRNIFIGGSFSHYMGMSMPGLALLGSNLSVESNFNPAYGIDGSVLNMIQQPDGKILIVGQFSSYRGFPVRNIVRIYTDGTIDNTFNPETLYIGDYKIMDVALLSSGKILIRYTLDQVNQQKIELLNSDGSIDLNFRANNPFTNGISVFAVQSDDKIVVGVGSSIKRLNANGTIDNSFSSMNAQNIRAITIQPDNKILVGADSFNINNVKKYLLTRLNNNGSYDNTFRANFVYAGNVITSNILLMPDSSIRVATIGGYDDDVLVWSISANGDNVEYSWDFNDIDAMPVTKIVRLPRYDFDGDGISEGGYLFIKNKVVGGTETGSIEIVAMNLYGQYDYITAYTLQSANYARYYGINGTVNSNIVQPDGRVIIGGSFSGIDGFSRNRIARLTDAGKLDFTFNPGSGANGSVAEVALQPDGKIVIIGSFTSYNGTARNRIARLNPDGSLDTGFNPGTGANGVIYYMKVQPDNKILIAGDFTSYNGTARNRIARINADGSLDSGFNPGTGADAFITCMTLQTDNKIVIVGNFSSYNGTSRSRIARLNSNGTLDTGFNPGTGADDVIQTVRMTQNGKIMIVGDFTGYNGSNRKSIARLNSDGSIDGTFVPGLVDDQLGTLLDVVTLSSGKLLVSGSYYLPNADSTNWDEVGIVRLNADGSFDASFNPGTGTLSGSVYPITVQSDSKIIISGDFGQFNSINRPYLARLYPDGQLDTAFYHYPNSGFDYDNNLTGIYDIKVQTDKKILVAGNFQSYDGTSRKGIARLNVDGSLDPAFNPGTGANGKINSLVIQQDGKILIGGDFTTYNGVSRNRIARLNPDGSLDTRFNPGQGCNGAINSIAVQEDGKILIGGYFTTYNGVSRDYIARLNYDGSLDQAFNISKSDLFFSSQVQQYGYGVKKIALLPDGKILVFRSVTYYFTFGGANQWRPHDRLLLFNTDGTKLSNNLLSYENITDFAVQKDGKILVSGYINGSTVYDGYLGITRFNPAGDEVDASFSTKNYFSRNCYGNYTNCHETYSTFGGNFYVENMLVQDDGKILLQGTFRNEKQKSTYNIIRLDQNGKWDSTFFSPQAPVAPYSDGKIFKIALQPDNKILVGGSFNQYNGFAHRKITRLENYSLKISTSVNPAVVCAGSQLTVSYSIPDELTFSSHNRLNVYLSDSMGNFINPIQVGTVSSASASGNITCTIPANTPSGTRYKLSITSSAPVIDAYVNLQVVNLVNKPANLGVTGNSCINSFVSYGALFSVENIPGTSYSWSNGQSGNPVRINSIGSYTLTVSHPVCPTPKTHNYTVSITPVSNCGGVLLIEADSVVNYFDTITVKVRMRGGSNIFSVFAKLQFESSKLSLVSSEVGNLLGSSIINSPAVVTDNSIDFGMTKTSGQSGSNGDGQVYLFKFVVTSLPYNQPNALSYTTFKLSDVIVNDATGNQRNMSLNPLPDTTRLRYYMPVWPGDLNNDRVCNVADLLRIGVFYNQTGFSRPNASLQWTAQPAYLWTLDNNNQGGLSPAAAIFADGNGDGIVSLADQTSVGFNLRRTHLRQAPGFEEPAQIINNDGIPLTVEITDTLIRRSQLPKNITARIQFGNAGTPYSNLYGLAFDLVFNPAYVDVNNITLNYNNTVFGTLNSNYIKVEDIDAASGKVSIGLTRYNTTELSGFGKVVDVTFPIKQGAPSGYFKVYAVPLAANDKSGVPMDISIQNDSVRVEAIVSGISQNSLHELMQVYPNPASTEINIKIRSKQPAPLTLEIFDVNGRKLYWNSIPATVGEITHRVDVSKFAKGMYILSITDKEGSSVNKFVVEE